MIDSSRAEAKKNIVHQIALFICRRIHMFCHFKYAMQPFFFFPASFESVPFFFEKAEQNISPACIRITNGPDHQHCKRERCINHPLGVDVSRLKERILGKAEYSFIAQWTILDCLSSLVGLSTVIGFSTVIGISILRR